MKKIPILLALVVLFLFLPGEARALELDRVRVAVLRDDEGSPLAAENVRLHLYRYEPSASPNQVNLIDLDAGSCSTGTDGRCEIWLLPGMPRDASGFYRGALEVRGLFRPILWPGGLLEVSLNLAHLQALEFGEEHEATGTLSIRTQSAINWPGVLVSIVLVGLAVTLVWRKWREQRRRGVLLGLLLGLALSGFLATPVQAAAPRALGDPDYCSGTGGVPIDLTRCYSTSELFEYLMRWGITELGVGAARSFDEAIWLADRLLAGLFDLTVNSPILVEIKDAFFKVVMSLMPGLLQQIVVGPTGLFYVAVALSGVLMAIPLWTGGSKLVRPERAIVWGVVLAVLFISGSGMGYDLVSAVETLRSEIIKQVMSGAVDAKAVVTDPMGASDISIDADTSWELPQAFEAKYFPEPVREEVTVYLFEPGVPIVGGSSGSTEVETDESMQIRQVAAGNSLIWAVLSLMGAVMLLLAAMTFAFLAVAAMMLILFLFAALPLGFFEFGSSILAAIIGKYLNVVMLSLAMAIFMRWVTAGISLIGSSSDIAGAIRYLVIILVMIYALTVISGSAFRLLTESGQVFGQSVQAVFGAGPNIMGGLGGALTGGTSAMSFGGNSQGGAAQENHPSMASSLVGGALSAVGFHAVSSAMQEPQAAPAKRGDAFRDDPRPSTSSGANNARPEEKQQDPRQPRANLFNLVGAETTLQTLAVQEGWNNQQVEIIKSVSRRNIPESEGVTSLAATPGFERSSPEAIERALNAAQVITSDPLVGPMKEKA